MHAPLLHVFSQVSLTGVTGERQAVQSRVEALLKDIKKVMCVV